MRYLTQVHARPLSRSCECVGLSRAAWYRSPLHWTVRDAEIIAALTEQVATRPSRGFWKCCQVLLRMQPDWNHKRIYRVYTAMQLNLHRKAKKRLPRRERAPLYVPKQPDIVWSADFMADALACGRRSRTFNVVDDFNRTFREDVLDQHLFTRLDDVREAASGWMIEYNQARPHDALGHLTPTEYRNHLAGSSTFEMYV